VRTSNRDFGAPASNLDPVVTSTAISFLRSAVVIGEGHRPQCGDGGDDGHSPWNCTAPDRKRCCWRARGIGQILLYGDARFADVAQPALGIAVETAADQVADRLRRAGGELADIDLGAQDVGQRV
jgi:hypothetical protein